MLRPLDITQCERHIQLEVVGCAGVVVAEDKKVVEVAGAEGC